MQTMVKTPVMNRRRHPRGASAARGWLQFRGDVSARETVSADLAREGAQFSTAGPREAGEQALVHLQLAFGGTIECKGKVCWSRCAPDGTCNFGVRFVDLADDEGEAIQCFLDSPVLQGAALAYA